MVSSRASNWYIVNTKDLFHNYTGFELNWWMDWGATASRKQLKVKQSTMMTTTTTPAATKNGFRELLECFVFADERRAHQEWWQTLISFCAWYSMNNNYQAHLNARSFFLRFQVHFAFWHHFLLHSCVQLSNSRNFINTLRRNRHHFARPYIFISRH